MEQKRESRPSGVRNPPNRGRCSWTVLLLKASLFCFWIQGAPAHLTIIPWPQPVAQGQDVTLTVQRVLNRPFSWHRGTDTSHQSMIFKQPRAQNLKKGPAYSGREKLKPDGSLRITNVTLSDTGSYTLSLSTFPFGKLAKADIQVLAQVSRPSLTASSTDTVELRDSVIFWCLPGDPRESVVWFVDNKALTTSDRLELSPSNRTLTLYNITRGDIGTYQCEARNPVSAQRSDPLTLTVSSLSPTHKPFGAAKSSSLGFALAGGALTAVLGYFLVTRKGRRKSGEPVGEPGPGGGSPPAPNPKRIDVAYVNVLKPTGSAPWSQIALEIPPESDPNYQTLISREMNIYDQIRPPA
ncbi:carcinoembryonic antigen-related cell adhesion molecule 2-like [Tachyglossus aculeatus]|uniref:carcinoembryonic antigen-related cell adhesion molecule 2-like n=1 Tax=Tachyglossus aculeatus TaxID=9261 RepID=UPI0018F4DD3D|nr:carcinoembryonic antigen-related cell adhesion molecule 2-like [Tachyglossus aculeatus]